MTTDARKVASHMIALDAAQPNHRTAISNCTDRAFRSMYDLWAVASYQSPRNLARAHLSHFL